MIKIYRNHHLIYIEGYHNLATGLMAENKITIYHKYGN